MGADTINGGPGYDTIVLTATSADLNSASDAQIVNVEAVSAATATSGVTINLHHQTEGFTITGSDYADTITGGSGNDTITAGFKNVTVDAGQGSDTVTLANDPSNVLIFNAETQFVGTPLSGLGLVQKAQRPG